MKIDDTGPIGTLYTEPIFKHEFPDIDINNLPNNFLKVNLTDSPSDIEHYKVEYVIDGNMINTIYKPL